MISYIALIIGAVSLMVTIAGFILGPFGKKRKEDTKLRFLEIRKELRDISPVLVEPCFNYYRKIDPTLVSLNCEIDNKPIYVLTKGEWIPPIPVLLDDVQLEPGNIANSQRLKTPQNIIKKAGCLWPYETLFKKFSSYHRAIEKLDKPTVFDNRDTFMIAKVEVIESVYKLAFKIGKYFDYIDTGEVMTFESAQTFIEKGKENYDDYLRKRLSKYRKRIGFPTDFAKRRPAVGVLTLTIFDADTNPKFIMHFRKRGKVAMSGEITHVVPAGEFQPAVSERIDSRSERWKKIVNQDFDIWRNIMREYSEELLNTPEILDEDYAEKWPFKELNSAKTSKLVAPYFLGFVLDPVCLKPDILTVCVFKKDSFSNIFFHGKSLSKFFKSRSKSNAEGDLDLGNDNMGINFNENQVKRYVVGTPTVPSGAACLALAWKHRKALGINVVEQS